MLAASGFGARKTYRVACQWVIVFVYEHKLALVFGRGNAYLIKNCIGAELYSRYRLLSIKSWRLMLIREDESLSESWH